MTKAELNKYQELLKNKRNELAGLTTTINVVAQSIAIAHSPDEMDDIQAAAERDVAIHNFDRETILLREVEDALSRVKDGSYGICLKCDEEMGTKRLAAVPWAPYCFACQNKAEAAQKKNGNFSGFGETEMATA
jgi:DnaK suppressor protein